MLKLNYAVASDRGLVRGNNEDSAYAGPNLLALADGMGGHAAGEIASQMMIRHLQNLDGEPGDNDMLAMLASVADDANRAIARAVRDAPETDGMGTTLTAIMFDGEQLALCHVGDSRGYMMRNDELEQITVDDTFVQSLVNEGKLAKEDVSTHPQRSLILKAYNGRPVKPSLRTIPAEVGDRLMLCSDGLSDPVTDSTIADALRYGTPDEAARRLVELALRSGGPDNVTVVVADILSSSDHSTAVPSTPLTAGALLGDAPEDLRPDTAAGRAAAMAAREPQTIPPAGSAPADKDKEEPTAEEKPKKPRRRKRRFFLTFSILLILLGGIVAAGWWGNNQVKKTYFVSTSKDAIVIEKGLNYSVFGRDLHTRAHNLCMDAEGDLSLLQATETTSNDPKCRTFKLQDLPESLRSSVSTLPEGSYDDVLQQTQRLAQQALPACVTRAPNPDNPSDPSSTGANSGDLTTPGVNCREVN